MRFLAWFYRNWADTDEGFHSDLQPLTLSLSPDEAFQPVIEAIGLLRGWRIEQSDPAQRTIHATRRTRLIGFIDDIHIRLEDTSPGTRLHARSQSRVGKGDFGQNRRNLLELIRALQQHGHAASCQPPQG